MHETTRSGPVTLDDDLGGTISNISIVNNTFALLNGPGTHGPFCVSVSNSLGLLNNVKIQNNAFYNCGNAEDGYVRFLGLGLTANIGYNSVYTTNGVAPLGGPNPNDVWMLDPQFVSFAARDFHLLPTSPVIDMGATLREVPTDKDGIVRPQGPRYDIGAYERPTKR